jgi:hypothetical protein
VIREHDAVGAAKLPRRTTVERARLITEGILPLDVEAPQHRAVILDVVAGLLPVAPAHERRRRECLLHERVECPHPVAIDEQIAPSLQRAPLIVLQTDERAPRPQQSTTGGAVHDLQTGFQVEDRIQPATQIFIALQAQHAGAPIAAFSTPTARTAARAIVDVIQIFHAAVETAI